MYYLQFGRWSFLAVGIMYGAYHQGRLSRREEKLRVIEEQQKAVRDAKLAEEKKRNAEGKKTINRITVKQKNHHILIKIFKHFYFS